MFKSNINVVMDKIGPFFIIRIKKPLSNTLNGYLFLFFI